jgi:hypothetical protein
MNRLVLRLAIISLMPFVSINAQRVTSVAPLRSDGTFKPNTIYVVVKDRVTWYCPDEKNVGTFIRPVYKEKGPDGHIPVNLNFFYTTVGAFPHNMVESSEKVDYIIACLKVE